MSMREWAKKEVEIACAREWAEANKNGDSGDYGCACYESALKAFESLCEDSHSGCSIQFTKQILMRLIDGKPLTPIEDTPEVWIDRGPSPDKSCRTYQCTRMFSLFKDVYPDGTVKYSDVDRVRCVDINDRSCFFTNDFLSKIIDEMHPIEMPYSPGAPITVVCETFLVDPKNGDFDTLCVLYILNEGGMREYINRYFKECDNRWVEIDKCEYLERKRIRKGGITL